MGATNDERLLNRLSTELSKVSGIRAIVLGGSRARGTAAPQSDYDLGLYYEVDKPLDIALLKTTTAALDDTGPAASVTSIGGWGPWINGGGWLTVESNRVDLLYRDLDRVRSVIRQCHAGQIERHYQPGHPHAFVSAIYMGEIAYCRPLWDPGAILEPLTLMFCSIFARFAPMSSIAQVYAGTGCHFRLSTRGLVQSGRSLPFASLGCGAVLYGSD